MLDTIALAPEEVMPTKPAVRHVANAVPHNNGQFLAQYAGPGMIPAYVADRQGQPRYFDSAEDAEVEARRVLFAVLNSRKRDSSKPERYRRLTGPEFAVLLAEASLTPTFFAYLYGTSPDRVMKWIDGVEDVPHPAMLMLEIMKQRPEAVDIAERATEAVTTTRRPARATATSDL